MRSHLILVVAVGLFLAMSGVTTGADGIVQWVFGIVDKIGWADVWRPLYNPEPMDTYAYRPLSVVLLKFALFITGRDPWLMSLIHSGILVAFGLVSAQFLVRHGFSRRISCAAAISAMAMPSVLFSAWICVEFDLLGAVFVLAAANALRCMEDEPARRHTIRFWFFAVLALTTKETSALQMLAYLGAFTWLRRAHNEWWRLTGTYLGLLLLVTLPMHFVESGNTHAFTLWSEGFHPIRIPAMVLHTGTQLVFLSSAAGAVLLGAAALRAVSVKDSIRTGVISAVVICTLCMPILRFYSHFEAVVFSDWQWPLFLLLLLVTGLIVLLRAAKQSEQTTLVMILFTFAGFAMAPVVLRFARADVSVRIFAACVPVLHALMWREAYALVKEQAMSRRMVGGLLGVVFGLFALSSAYNTISFHRARMPVEQTVKQALASDLRMSCPAIINTNPVQLLSIEEIVALGGRRLGECAWVETTSGNPQRGMTLDEFAATGGIQVDIGQDAYLHIATARSQMSSEANAKLQGNFEWTRNLMPESDDDLYQGYQRMIYEVETDIEQLFRQEGTLVSESYTPYLQLPLWWLDIPRRLLAGVPIIESYGFLGRVYKVVARKPGWHPPGGRSRKDIRAHH